MTALSHAPLSLRVLPVLLFSLYALNALNASFLELFILLILGLLVSKTISIAMGRRIESSAYEGTSVLLVYVYINYSIACLIYRDPISRLFTTFFMSFGALSELFPDGREGYWVRDVDSIVLSTQADLTDSSRLGHINSRWLMLKVARVLS